MKNYKDTLNLPKTGFSMKADLANREPSWLALWDELDVYHKAIKRNSGNNSFILHDGPPYANGNIHVGHTLNKVLKDIIVRYKLMRGYYAPYVPGWDCHGQPIEHKVEKELAGAVVSREEVRKKCREYAEFYIGEQKGQFKRLGVLGEWEKPYLTMDHEYEATDIEVFGELYKKGFIYRGKKPIYWCQHCRTALAEAEIEYKDKNSYSITVKLPAAGFEFGQGRPAFFLIWTTTPWTLPANVAIAVKPEAAYSAVKAGEEIYIMASDLVETYFDEYETLAEFKGSELEGKEYTHPVFEEKKGKAVTGDFVGLDTGTGIVHIAPGHGEDDYRTGLKYGLEIVMPVDDGGNFTKEAGRFSGHNIIKANPLIIGDLKERGLLVSTGEISHSYPHCWRCKQPVIFRATEQWFISVDKGDFRDKMLEIIDKVKWYPEWSINRIKAMVGERPDWCISRQRVWGIPIPVFYCKSCGSILLNDETIHAVAALFRSEGSDSWFTKEAEQILPEGSRCANCGESGFTKENDILDVWFESGISHFAVLRHREELSWPADLYVEGSDQHRGWFQSSLFTSMGVEEKAPYRGVLTHGFVVDEKGRKMSKSEGNVVDPLEVIDKLGADILRLWTVSADYTSDMAIAPAVLERVSEAYRRIRNTARFILGNIYDFDSRKDSVAPEGLLEIDRWALMQLQRLILKVEEYFESYRFYLALSAIQNFCTVEMSSFYLDVLKDRLYTSYAGSVERRSAQTALFTIIQNLALMLAPILSFTAEEIWQSLSPENRTEESIVLAGWPEADSKLLDDELEKKWDRLFSLRKAVLKALETARDEKIIRSALEARVIIGFKPEWENIISSELGELPFLFIVSQVEAVKEEEISSNLKENMFKYYDEETKNTYFIATAEGGKCSRCWNYNPETGSNPLYEELCPRCARVIDTITAKGG